MDTVFEMLKLVRFANCGISGDFQNFKIEYSCGWVRICKKWYFSGVGVGVEVLCV